MQSEIWNSLYIAEHIVQSVMHGTSSKIKAIKNPSSILK